MAKTPVKKAVDALTHDAARRINVPTAEMASLFEQQAVRDPQPEIRIRADRDTRYGLLARIMGAARVAGMKRLGFVTQPGATTPVPPASTM